MELQESSNQRAAVKPAAKERAEELKEGPCGWLETGQGEESGRRETGQTEKSRFSGTVKGRLGCPNSTRKPRGALDKV